MKAHVVLTQDPMADLRSPEEKLAVETKKRVDEMQTKPRNAYSSISYQSTEKQRFVACASVFTGGSGLKSPFQIAYHNYMYIGDYQSYKIGRPTAFNLYIGSSFVRLSNFDLTVEPTDFTTDVYATVMFPGIDDIYENVLINVKIGTLSFSTLTGLSMDADMQVFDLLDTIPSRKRINGYQDFRTNRDKITDEQLERLLNDNSAQLTMSIAFDEDGMSTTNKNFLFNNYNNGSLNFTPTFRFLIFGNLAAFTPTSPS